MTTPDGTLVLDVNTVTALAGGQILASQRGWLLGFTVANEDAVNAATVDLVDGADAKGRLLMRLRVAANFTVVECPGMPGWPIAAGVFVNVLAGAASVSTTVGRVP